MPGKPCENSAPSSSTDKPEVPGAGFTLSVKLNLSALSVDAIAISGNPSVNEDEVQSMVMKDPGGGDTADKGTRGSLHEIGVYHAQPAPEHQGKDFSSAHPTDDDDEVTEEAAECPSPQSVLETLGQIMAWTLVLRGSATSMSHPKRFLGSLRHRTGRKVYRLANTTSAESVRTNFFVPGKLKKLSAETTKMRAPSSGRNPR